MSLSTSPSIELSILTSSQNSEINKQTTGLTITNTQTAEFSSVSVSRDSSALGATTNYLVSFTPANTIERNTVVLVKLPSQISVDTSSTMTCTSVLLIDTGLTCAYDTATRTVTVSNGFAASASYVASQVEFKISNLINPATALTTDSFEITTQTATGVQYAAVSSGVTVTKECNSPCKTCLTDLSSCTSCDTTSEFPYLSNSN